MLEENYEYSPDKITLGTFELSNTLNSNDNLEVNAMNNTLD